MKGKQFTERNLHRPSFGKKYWNNGTPVAGQQAEYVFDDIGNRKTVSEGGNASGTGLRQSVYTANLLNQYSQRTIPNAVDIIGNVSQSATLTINNQRPDRTGDYFRHELTIDNNGAAVYQGVTNLAVVNNGTNADIIATNIGSVFLPESPEVFGYDSDGNLTNDGRWTFSWNAENRLTNITALAGTPTAAKYRLDFAYDYQGRRIQKRVSTNNGSGYLGQSTNTFIYDGWNLIAILDGNGSVMESFHWGLDLSGSEQGAGGVGGLISMTIHSGPLAGTYFYCPDGNGNIIGLTRASDGTAAARYEYDSFGKLLRASGPMAFLNPFLFSSKYYDWETGLLYYGHRYYSPSLARWLSRDPIEENGGPNVYGFAGNDPVNALDLFGLLITCQCPETYFNENGLKDKYEKEADDTYSAKAGASGPTTGDGAILWNMLLTKHNFVIKDYTVDNLKLHVASRNIIIKNALNSLVGFGHNPVIRRPSPTANPDPQAYYDSLNNTQTALGCQVWSEIIFQTGNRYKTRVKRDIDGVWIPGDWGWINNKNFRHGGSWTAGFEGENVFNTGNDLFWGLDLPNKHKPESKSWWWNQIKTTFISNDGKTFRDPEWDKNKAITFPGVGLAP